MMHGVSNENLLALTDQCVAQLPTGLPFGKFGSVVENGGRHVSVPTDVAHAYSTMPSKRSVDWVAGWGRGAAARA
jgi:hypothetical protein